MMIKKIALLSLIFLSVASEIFAENVSMSPYQPAVVQQNQLLLKPEAAAPSTVFIVRNQSSGSLLLNRVLANNPGVSAGWSSNLDSKQWSALNLRAGDVFNLSCLSPSGQIVSCKASLQLYQLKTVPASVSSESSYWVVENQTKKQLLQAL